MVLNKVNLKLQSRVVLMYKTHFSNFQLLLELLMHGSCCRIKAALPYPHAFVEYFPNSNHNQQCFPKVCVGVKEISIFQNSVDEISSSLQLEVIHVQCDMLKGKYPGKNLIEPSDDCLTKIIHSWIDNSICQIYV